MLGKIQNLLRNLGKKTLISTAILLLFFIIVFFITRLFAVPASSSPQKIFFSNLTDHSATLTWESSNPTPSRVLVSGKNNFPPFPLNIKFIEDAKKGIKTNSHTLHYVNLTSLNPNQDYWVGIYIGWNRVKTLKIHTTPKIVNKNPSEMIGGRVFGPDKKTKVAGVNIFYQAEFGATQSAILSTVTDKTGTWKLDIGNLMDQNLNAFFPIKEGVKQTVIFDAGGVGNYKLSTRSAQLKHWPNAVLKGNKK